MKKNVFAWIAVVAVISGCGSNTSNDSKTTAQTVSVTNRTESNLASATFEIAETESVLHTTNIDCRALANNCIVSYNGQKTTEKVNIIFKDNNDNIVAGYVLNNGIDGNRNYIVVSHGGTGEYLISKLRKKQNNVNLQEKHFDIVLSDLVSLFPSNKLKGYSDHGSKITSNYLFKIREGHNPNSYVEYINSMLQKNAKIPADQFLDIYANFQTYAVSGSCPKELISFLTIGQKGSDYLDLKSYIPYGDKFGKILGDISTLFCSSPADTRLDQILSQLKNIETTLTNLYGSQSDTEQFLAQTSLNNNYQEFVVAENKVRGYANDLDNILTQYPSLKDYVTKNGGLIKALADEPPAGVLHNLMFSMTTSNDGRNLIQVIDDLTKGALFANTILSLDLLCKKPIAGYDLISNRVSCNLAIAQISLKLLAIQSMIAKVASNVYEVLDEYPAEALKYGYDNRTNEKAHLSAMNADFTDQGNQLASLLKKTIKNSNGVEGYYIYYNGMPSALLDNVESLKCTSNVDSKGISTPAVTSWILQTDSTEYLETYCKDPVTSNRVLARFYINLHQSTDSIDPIAYDTNKLINVYGVLVYPWVVPRFGTHWYRGGGSGNIAGDYIYAKLSSDLTPRTFYWDPLASTDGLGYTNKKGDFLPDVGPYPADGPRNVLGLTYTGADFDGLSAFTMGPSTNPYSQYPAYIRFTNQDGYSNVFVLASEFDSGINWLSLYCVSKDCTSRGNYGNLTFDKESRGFYINHFKDVGLNGKSWFFWRFADDKGYIN